MDGTFTAVKVYSTGQTITFKSEPPDYIARWSGVTVYPPGVWEKIDRAWTDIDDPKFDHPQPVNLTPGALGIRQCE